MTRGDTTVDIREVAQRFGTLDALGPLSLTVGRRALVALVGPSGCGKSSLLRLVAGLDRPCSGTIMVDGEPVDGPDPSRGMVFQQPALFPWLTVEANIRFGLEEQGLESGFCRRTASDWLQAVDIAAFAHAHPATLSGGMAQRAALARALAPEPSLLLLDEPFGALDSLTRRDMQGLLEQVRQRAAATVMLVTHDVEEAIFLADRVIILSPRPGRMVGDIAVDLPHPRSDAIRLSPPFVALRRRVDDTLASARTAA